jgi:hypothetical protein
MFERYYILFEFNYLSEPENSLNPLSNIFEKSTSFGVDHLPHLTYVLIW